MVKALDNQPKLSEATDLPGGLADADIGLEDEKDGDDEDDDDDDDDDEGGPDQPAADFEEVKL